MVVDTTTTEKIFAGWKLLGTPTTRKITRKISTTLLSRTDGFVVFVLQYFTIMYKKLQFLDSCGCCGWLRVVLYDFKTSNPQMTRNTSSSNNKMVAVDCGGALF